MARKTLNIRVDEKLKNRKKMNKVWSDEVWDDYVYWQSQDKKTLKRINNLIKDIDRNGNTGIQNSEPLKHDLQGSWSRRIDDVNRLYCIENKQIEIAQCRIHYKK